MLLLTALVAIVTATWLLWKIRGWQRKLKLGNSLPGPPALPILGNADVFINDPRVQLNVVQDLVKKYGEYMRFWMGPDLNIMVTNPYDVKKLLTSPKVTYKGPVYKNLYDVIGPGLLSGGSVWRHHRKLVTPSYNKTSVHNFCQVFNMEGLALVEALRGRDPKKTFNAYCDVVKATTQCVCQTLMGQSKEETQNLEGLDDIVKETPRLYTCAYERMSKWWYEVPFVFRLMGGTRFFNNFNSLKDRVVGKMVQNRIKALKRKDAVDENKMSIIDRLIMGGDLNERQVIEESFTLFTTSQEAAAKVASGLLVFFAYLPEWQERVYEEIQERLADDEFVSDEQLKSLQYLDMVYKEVLRYMSIAAIIQRTANEDITIDSGRITIPAGTSVLIPLHCLHRDPKYWDDPEKVKPERFMPENVMKRNPNAFVPFSLGPMDCLGRIFGTAMIKILIVWVLRHYRLEADGCLEDLDISVAISVRFADGYNLRVRPRKPEPPTNSA